jgi:hypothetical protein
MATITPDSLLTLEAYAKVRKSSRADAIAHRRLHSVRLGEHMTLQFEDELTIRRQIRRCCTSRDLRRGPSGRDRLLCAARPDGGNWKATLLIEYPDDASAGAGGAADRRRGPDVRRVEGHARVYAIADGTSTAGDERRRRCTSSASSSRRRSATRSVRRRRQLGCDHTNFRRTFGSRPSARQPRRRLR